jgi:hypothetical protein
MAPAANLDDLNRRRLTDIAFRPIHGFQPHFTGIAAMASDAAETFRCMDVRFVALGGLCESFDA